jgi:hypothetical protein
MKKSERKLQMRQEAKRKIHGPSGGVTGSKEYREAVEKGRQTFLSKSAEGGDSRAQRIKGELNYLINNYLPAHDNRIEALIDDWRRSGDPTYDPAIRVRHRRAKQNHINGYKRIKTALRGSPAPR